LLSRLHLLCEGPPFLTRFPDRPTVELELTRAIFFDVPAAASRWPDRLLKILSITKEEVMNDKRFSTPVSVRRGAAHRRAIASAWEAFEWLQQHRPVTPSRSYRAALRACRDALDGWRSANQARRAFVAALREVGRLSGH
jgi:hypothetical protein